MIRLRCEPLGSDSLDPGEKSGAPVLYVLLAPTPSAVGARQRRDGKTLDARGERVEATHYMGGLGSLQPESKS